MRVTYSPASGDVQTWDFTARKVRVGDAERIERRYENPFTQWVTDVHRGMMGARRVLLWHLLDRTHPGYRWIDVPDFAVGEVECELTRDELQLARTRAERDKSIDPEVKALMLEAFDAQIDDAPEIVGVESGKAG